MKQLMNGLKNIGWTKMSNQKIVVDHKYLDLVPRPTDEERRALSESIMIHGQREPIVTNQNYVILDGHTRFEICQELGLEPKYRIEKFDTETLERGYVIEANLKRRHLSTFQKIELSYSLYLEMVAERKSISLNNLRSSNGSIKLEKKGRSDVNLGRYVGVSSSLISMGVSLIKNADDALKTQLRNGTITITKAYDSIHKRRGDKRKHRNYISKIKSLECPFCHEVFKKNRLIVHETVKDG